jgi:hypothetical protein
MIYSAINLPNTDLGFSGLESKVGNIVQQMLLGREVSIMLNSEGPDIEMLGLYKLLDSLCTLFNFPKSKINIYTRNLLEYNDAYNIKVNPPITFAYCCQEYSKQLDYTKEGFSKRFGIFIGRSNWQRLWLASHLYSNHKLSTLLTYHYNYSDDYHRANLGLDMLISEVGTSILTQATNLLIDAPMLYDTIVGYPIDGRKETVPSIDLAPRYKEFFVEVVCETYTNGKTFFPTEKTWRPIMCKTPFIIQGPQNFLANIRALGIKTFSAWWDESYDYQPGKTKIEEITKVIDMLALKSEKELAIMYNEMMPTLEHNYNVLMHLTPEQMLAATYVK